MVGVHEEGASRREQDVAVFLGDGDGHLDGGFVCKGCGGVCDWVS